MRWPGVAAVRRARPRRRAGRRAGAGRRRRLLGKPVASVRLEAEGRRITDRECRRAGRDQDRAIRWRCGRSGRPSRTCSASAGSRTSSCGRARRGAGGARLRADAAAPDPEDRVRRTAASRASTRAAAPGAGRALRRVAAGRARRRWRRSSRRSCRSAATASAAVTARVDLEHAPIAARWCSALTPGARTHVDEIEVSAPPGIATASVLRELGLSRGRLVRARRLNERITRFVDSRKRTGSLRGAADGHARVR